MKGSGSGVEWKWQWEWNVVWRGGQLGSGSTGYFWQVRLSTLHSAPSQGEHLPTSAATTTVINISHQLTLFTPFFPSLLLTPHIHPAPRVTILTNPPPQLKRPGWTSPFHCASKSPLFRPITRSTQKQAETATFCRLSHFHTSMGLDHPWCLVSCPLIGPGPQHSIKRCLPSHTGKRQRSDLKQ